MRIAMLGVKSVPAIGGVARYVEEIGTRLVERGHSVTVYCRPHYTQGEGPYRGMERIVVRGVRGKHLDTITHTYSALRHALRSNYDIIHFHAVGPALLIPLAGKCNGTGIVVTAHGPDWELAKWGPVARTALRMGSRMAARWARGWVAVSESLARECERVAGRRPTVIPSGVAIIPAPKPHEILALGLRPGEYLLSAGRLTPEKGLHYLLEAFRLVDTHRRLVIAGDCPNGSSYAAKLRDMADERVLFTGYVTGRLLQELFAHAYLYCQPSENEGLPMAVLEAMSYGRCVLASDIPPHREALAGHGRTFTSRDVVDLASKLQRLLQDRGEVERIGRAAQAHVTVNRTWNTTTDGYERLYTEILRGHTQEAVFPEMHTGTVHAPTRTG